MNLIPSSVGSITVANLITLVCRILSCDSEYEYPVTDADVAASQLSEKTLDIENDLTTPLKWPNEPEVEIETGRIRGYYMTAVRGQRISAFEGIPYAEPTERWKDPVPKKPWTPNVLGAKKIGPTCLQLHYGRLKGESENECLVVNVYTRNVNPVKPYPVIIFIHGGFWISGSGGQYGPSFLVGLNEVILVTFNYRLGVLGFFSSGDEVAPGNYGLKDQALLIEWVHRNIAAFGGDPKRITVTGSSAGAVNANLHMMSNYESKNKIASVVSWSGTAYNIWGLNRHRSAAYVSTAMANVSGCPTDLGSKVMVECLRGVDATTLVANQILTVNSGYFIPSIEPDIPGAFLTYTADEAYALGKVARIPWIASMTSRELNVPATGQISNILVSTLRAAITSDLAAILSVRWMKIDEDQIRRKIIEYYGTGSRESVNDLGQEEISKIATDRYFSVPTHRALQMHSQIAPTYGVIFNYASKLGRAGKLGFNNHAEFGVLHGDDLTYLLNSTVHHPPIRRFDSHFAITKLLVNLYGNFAKFGEPIYIDEDKMQYRIWDAIESPEKLRYLWVDEETKMIDDPYKNISTFWEGLGLPDVTPYLKL